MRASTPASGLIAHLGDTYRRVAPDVCVILGDDQHELFQDDHMPTFAIYHGESVEDRPHQGGGGPRAYSDPAVGNHPTESIAQPTDAELGMHLIKSAVAAEFDVARSNKLPVSRSEGKIGHAFYYFYRRLMDNKAIPNVPIMVNTYYPPNAPSAARCYKFGQAIGRALLDWDAPKRVAIFASGGLSHTVIEEDIDYRIIEGLQSGDTDKLLDYPDERFRAGTSEIKNWIALAGVMSVTGEHGPGRLRALLSDGSGQRLRHGLRRVGLGARSSKRTSTTASSIRAAKRSVRLTGSTGPSRASGQAQGERIGLRPLTRFRKHRRTAWSTVVWAGPAWRSRQLASALTTSVAGWTTTPPRRC